MLRNNADARRCSYFELGLPVVLQVTFYCETHKTVNTVLFIECFCVAKRKPVRSEKPKPQTTITVSLWFCGLLTSWTSLWLVTTQLTFLKFFSHSRFSAFDSKNVNWVSWFNSITHAISKVCPWVGEGSLTNSSMASQNVQLTTLSRTSHANLTWSAKFLGQLIRNKIDYTCTIKHHYSVVQVNFVTNR